MRVPSPRKKRPTRRSRRRRGARRGQAEGGAAGCGGCRGPVARRAAVRPRIGSAAGGRGNRQLAEQLGLAPPPPLIVSDLLTRSDIREVTQYAGELQETTLDGIEPSPQYNAIRLSAGEAGYGAALQVAVRRDAPGDEPFRRLRETYFDQNVDGTPVANEAFQASFFGLEHYAFLHRASKSVAVVSCDADVCTGRQTRTLASRASTRL